MLRLTVCLSFLTASLAFAQDASSATTSPVPSADAGVGAQKKAKPELDLSNLPFSPDTIRMVVNHSSDQIQACYEDTLAGTHKKVEGKLLTSFTINPQGLVKGAKVLKKGTTLKDPKLHDCVVAVLTAMNFPAPPDGADHPVEYPFNLKAIE